MIQDQNNWPFEVKEQKRPLILRIIFFPFRMLFHLFVIIFIFLFAGIMGKVKHESQMKKKYKKKIVDLGFYSYTIWEEK